MIAKISKGDNLRGMVLYNSNKVDEKEAFVLCVQNFPINTDGIYKSKDLIKFIEHRADLNERVKEKYIHISLNPSPNDVLTNEQLEEIAKEYMQDMGFGDQPYAVFKHEDIARHHLHIVTTNIDWYGKKISDSNERYRSQAATRRLEQKYGLHNTQDSTLDEQWKPQKINPDKNISRQIKQNVNFLMKYNFVSFKEYKFLLSLYNMTAEEIRGEANGSIYTGLLYSATNNSRERIANPIKASTIGKSAGLKALEEKYEKSALLLKESGEGIKNKLRHVMSNATSEEAFKKEMRKRNIDVVFRKNSEGRIFGAIIIDHTTKLVTNGSRLGKEFSGNVFNELFNGKKEKVSVQSILQNTTKECQETPKEQVAYSSNTFTETTSILGLGLISLFDGGQDHFDEEAYKKRRKKKRKRGLCR